jgi:hypothetical protein
MIHFFCIAKRLSSQTGGKSQGRKDRHSHDPDPNQLHERALLYLHKAVLYRLVAARARRGDRRGDKSHRLKTAPHKPIDPVLQPHHPDLKNYPKERYTPFLPPKRKGVIA